MLDNGCRSTAERIRRRVIRGRVSAALLLVGMAGCSPAPVGGEAAPLPPQGVLEREEFVRVMTEVQLIEAVADKRIYRNDNERQRLAEAYNDKVMRCHNQSLHYFVEEMSDSQIPL